VLLTQHLNSGDYAILTEREAPNPVIARGTKWPAALAALDDRRVSAVKCAIHS